MKRFHCEHRRAAVAFRVSKSQQSPSINGFNCDLGQATSFSLYSRQKFRILRFLVLQMAVVHVMIFLILNLVSIESPETFQSIDKYQSVMNFFAPFIAVTIILGVWGFQITIRTIVPYYSNLKLLQKYSSFQLVLVFCKLQPVLLNLAFKQIIEDCEGVLTVDVKIRSELCHATYNKNFN